MKQNFKRFGESFISKLKLDLFSATPLKPIFCPLLLQAILGLHINYFTIYQFEAMDLFILFHVNL